MFWQCRHRFCLELAQPIKHSNQKTEKKKKRKRAGLKTKEDYSKQTQRTKLKEKRGCVRSENLIIKSIAFHAD